MKLAAVYAANGGQISDDPKHDDAASQAVEAIKFCVGASEKLFAELKCSQIIEATRRLKNTPQNPLSWSELNTRSRALRDIIEVELRGYLFYQYPKLKGDKLRAW